MTGSSVLLLRGSLPLALGRGGQKGSHVFIDTLQVKVLAIIIFHARLIVQHQAFERLLS